jgi:hypothetical protein
LFSRDFLSSLTQSEYDGFMNSGLTGLAGNNNGGGPVGSTTTTTSSNSTTISSSRILGNNNRNLGKGEERERGGDYGMDSFPSSTPPAAVNYPNYRRGSAPPVVLSVVTNSLADLDSLADELVSEPATSASQLFNMPTVFPGSIKGSINEYL